MTIVMASEAAFVTLRDRFTWYKNKYVGKRCFCVGNGPSLAKTPLHLLEQEYTFGLNKIADIFPETTWRPDFYVMVTVLARDSNWAAASKIAMKDTVSVIGVSTIPHLLEKTDGVYMIPDNILPVRVTKLAAPIWSDDVFHHVSKYGTSMVAVLQVAAYMGFNPIYLLGCDLGWKPFDYEENKDPNHFSEGYWAKAAIDDKNEVIVTPELAQRYTNDAIAGHKFAKRELDRAGVLVYNATLGGDLEVYPRVKLEEILCSS